MAEIVAGHPVLGDLRAGRLRRRRDRGRGDRLGDPAARRSPRARAEAGRSPRRAPASTLVKLDDAVDELDLEVGLSGALYGGGVAGLAATCPRSTAQHVRDESFEEYRAISSRMPARRRSGGSPTRIERRCTEALATISAARAEHAGWVRANVSATAQVAAARRATRGAARRRWGTRPRSSRNCPPRFAEEEWSDASQSPRARRSTTPPRRERSLAIAAQTRERSDTHRARRAGRRRASLRRAEAEARTLEETHRLVTPGRTGGPRRVRRGAHGSAAGDRRRGSSSTRVDSDRLGAELRAIEAELAQIEIDARAGPLARSTASRGCATASISPWAMRAPPSSAFEARAPRCPAPWPPRATRWRMQSRRSPIHEPGADARSGSPRRSESSPPRGRRLTRWRLWMPPAGRCATPRTPGTRGLRPARRSLRAVRRSKGRRRYRDPMTDAVAHQAAQTRSARHRQNPRDPDSDRGAARRRRRVRGAVESLRGLAAVRVGRVRSACAHRRTLVDPGHGHVLREPPRRVHLHDRELHRHGLPGVPARITGRPRVLRRRPAVRDLRQRAAPLALRVPAVAVGPAGGAGSRCRPIRRNDGVHRRRGRTPRAPWRCAHGRSCSASPR